MGLEAVVTVANPSNCPVAAASESTGVPASSVARSGPTDDTVVEEFELGGAIETPPETTEVFDGDGYGVYRFEREPGRECVCDRVEAAGCPVADVSAVEGRLRVVFRPTDVESLRGTVERLREHFEGVHLEHLVRSGDGDAGDTVVVDRGRLTDRQREVLETAHEMGYFEHPKGANAQEVAAELGVTSATFRGHLSAAQSKLLEQLLAE